MHNHCEQANPHRRGKGKKNEKSGKSGGEIAHEQERANTNRIEVESMKISQFIISATGFLYSAATGNLPAVILFGILAFVSFRRTMIEITEEGGYYT